MCGIAGKIALTGEAVIADSDEAELRSALLSLKHRGPDHSAIAKMNTALFGHNRLSILDLSPDANQPMTDSSGRYMIVFNGEIFNYKALRSELESGGLIFKTRSDTEVLLQLLIREGSTCLHKLNGFFAFSFHDSYSGNTIIARDRFGEKPLWYATSGGKLHFASELRALNHLGIKDEIDRDSVAMFLQFTYIPAPFSIFRNVRKLCPGEMISVSSGQLEISSWYLPAEKKTENRSESEASDELNSLLTDAVQLRLNADVKVGCFLSGGVDSSIIAMLAKKLMPDLKTFSIGFPDSPYLNESQYASEVAGFLGTDHTEIQISSQDFEREVDTMFSVMDEPFGDSSAIASLILARKTKDFVTVALSGDGADELFAGYNKHEALLRSMQSNLTNKFIALLHPLIDHLPKGRGNKPADIIRKASRYGEGLKLDFRERYLRWASFSDAAIVDSLVKNSSDVIRRERIKKAISNLKDQDFNSVLLTDQQLVLGNDMLLKVDLTSMANSLEIRPPFLDYRIVEFANSLPASMKINSTGRKIILRKTFAGALPASVFNRRKQGFEVPMEAWLRGSLRTKVDSLLRDEQHRIFELIDAKTTVKVLNEFYTQDKNEHAALIYCLLVLAGWIDKN